MTPDTARRLLWDAAAPWTQALDIDVEAVTKEEVILSLPRTPDITNRDGHAVAAALNALADAAMALMCASHHGLDRLPPALHIDIKHLRIVSEDQFYAIAQITQTFATKIQVNCAILSQPSGKAVSLADATYPL